MFDSLVLYHGQCRDGWCAAWTAHKCYPGAELRPAMYGTPPPEDAAGRKVLLLDFCYPRAEMEALCRVADVCVLDHHKTAQAALEGLTDAMAREGRHVAVAFDMERSGAGIAWDQLLGRESGLSAGAHEGRPWEFRPWLVNYVEDRDLWRWALPHSREVNAYISTLPYGRPEHLEAWNEAERMPLTEVIASGRVALQAVKRYAEAVCENAMVRRVRSHPNPSLANAYWDVPSVNAPQHDISEVLERLMDLNPGAKFVHGWWQRADGIYSNSLRSRGDFDVSAVARGNGGGGHRNAAGYQTREAP